MAAPKTATTTPMRRTTPRLGWIGPRPIKYLSILSRSLPEVKDDFTAAGLAEAKKKLDKLHLTPEQRKEYNAFVGRLHRIASRQEMEMEEVRDKIEEAKEEVRLEEKTKMVIELHKIGMSLENIVLVTQLNIGQVQQIIDKYQKEKD